MYQTFAFLTYFIYILIACAKKLILKVEDFLFSNENMCCVSAVYQALCQSLDRF